MIDKSVPSQFSNIKLDQLVYVELEARNGGMMLTVSEEGFTFRAVTSVRPSGRIPFSFLIHGTEKLEGYGEIKWTKDEGKVAGLQFTDISTEFVNALRKWLAELSTPTLPSSPELRADNALNLGHSLTAKLSSHEPTAKTPPQSDFGMNFGHSPEGGLRPNEAAQASAHIETAAAPLPRTTHILSDWNYAEALPGETRASGNGVVIAATVACLLLLAILLFSFRETIGRSLISLGQTLSSPSSAPSESSQAEVPDNPKPAEDHQPPANAAKENNTASNGGENSSPSQAATKGENLQTVRPPADREKTVAPPAKEEQFRDEKPAPPADEGAAKPTRSQDPAQDVRSLWSAVGQGNTAAEVTLAKLYMIGGGVPKNCDQARVLLKAAVKKGNAEAVTTLSQLNRQGCP
jgi:hypothetical protein